MNIQAAADATFQAASMRLAHVNAPARRDPDVLALKRPADAGNQGGEESCSVRSFERYVFAVRPRTRFVSLYGFESSIVIF